MTTAVPPPAYIGFPHMGPPQCTAQLVVMPLRRDGQAPNMRGHRLLYAPWQLQGCRGGNDALCHAGHLCCFHWQQGRGPFRPSSVSFGARSSSRAGGAAGGLPVMLSQGVSQGCSLARGRDANTPVWPLHPLTSTSGGDGREVGEDPIFTCDSGSIQRRRWLDPEAKAAVGSAQTLSLSYTPAPPSVCSRSGQGYAASGSSSSGVTPVRHTGPAGAEVGRQPQVCGSGAILGTCSCSPPPHRPGPSIPSQLGQPFPCYCNGQSIRTFKHEHQDATWKCVGHTYPSPSNSQARVAIESAS